MIKRFPKLECEEWLEFSKNLFTKYDFQNNNDYHSKGAIINVYDFVYNLTACMQDNDILVAGNGSACVCAHQTAVVKNNQRIFWNSGDASMGYDLPASIGACLEANGRNVVCLAGDGSIMMNIQELETISYNKFL